MRMRGGSGAGIRVGLAMAPRGARPAGTVPAAKKARAGAAGTTPWTAAAAAAARRGSEGEASVGTRRASGDVGASSLVRPPGDLEDFADEGEVARLRASLLDWYDAHHRVLPWRKNPHSTRGVAHADDAGAGAGAGAEAGGVPPPEAVDFAYGVWVSEVMLQQTQVATVVAYWTAWVRRWPDAEALAAASEDEVQRAWAGLGYYRRARLLHAGAKALVDRRREACASAGAASAAAAAAAAAAAEGAEGGASVSGWASSSFPSYASSLSSSSSSLLPQEASELLKVPGVGRYTAGAIASIAFGRREPVVDGNVVRVLSRLRAMPVTLDPAAPEAVRHHWHLAGRLVDPDRPGCFNQALMELGATVCRKAAPECDRCPIRFACLAANTPGLDPATLPPPKTKTAKDQLASVLVVEAAWATATWVLLTRRPRTGLLANTWEFPMAVVDAAQGEEEVWPDARGVAEDALGAPLASLPGVLSVSGGPPLPPITHVFSHRRHLMRPASLRLAMRDRAALDALVAAPRDADRVRWVRLDERGLPGGGGAKDGQGPRGLITTKGPAKVLDAFLAARQQSRLISTALVVDPRHPRA